jgi:hypothetical protein
LPTHRYGEEVNNEHDRIAFKTEIEKVKNRLLAKGYQEKYVIGFLRPALELYDDIMAWRYMEEGLALFIGENYYKKFTCPTSFKKESFITGEFIVTPLLPLIVNNGEFFILSLSKHQIKLYKADRFSIEEINLEQYNVPVSIDEYLKYFEFRKQTQGKARDAFSGSDIAGVHYHGHEQEKDNANAYLLEYFKKVNTGLADIINESHAPLVLMGVEYEVSMYRKANSYNFLSEAEIWGNFEHANKGEIHQRAWNEIRKIFEQPVKKRLNNYNLLAGTGKTSYDLKEVFKSAVSGRVESVMLYPDKHVWADIKDENNVIIHEEQQEDDIDLLNSIAVQTLLNSGEAIPVTEETMPEKEVGADLAAVYRY